MNTQLNLLDRDWCNVNAPVVLSAMRGREFTADEIHPLVSEPDNKNLYGILFAVIKKHLEKVGYRPSSRPEANGRVVAVWRVKQEVAA